MHVFKLYLPIVLNKHLSKALNFNNVLLRYILLTIQVPLYIYTLPQFNFLDSFHELKLGED